MGAQCAGDASPCDEVVVEEHLNLALELVVVPTHGRPQLVPPGTLLVLDPVAGDPQDRLGLFRRGERVARQLSPIRAAVPASSICQTRERSCSVSSDEVRRPRKATFVDNGEPLHPESLRVPWSSDWRGHRDNVIG